MENLELSKICYNNYEWNIIELNPLAMDTKVLRRTLIKLAIHLNDILKFRLDKRTRLSAYSDTFFPYIIDHYNILEKLELIHFFLKLFLF